jgi:hypothetical protein
VAASRNVFRPATVAPAAVPASGKATVPSISALHLDRAKLEYIRVMSYRRDLAFKLLRIIVVERPHAVISTGAEPG